MMLLASFLGCLLAFVFAMAIAYTYLKHQLLPTLMEHFKTVLAGGGREGAARNRVDVLVKLRELAEGLTKEQAEAIGRVLTTQQLEVFLEVMSMAFNSDPRAPNAEPPPSG